MNKDRWTGIIAAGLVAVATVVGSTGEAQAQKFRLRDLFQKNGAANSGAGSKEKPAEAASQSVDKAEAAMEEAGSANSGEGAADKASDAGNTGKVASNESRAGKLKEQSTSEQLKSLTGKLDKAGADPDVLLQSARERFRAMKARESSSKEGSAEVARSTSDKDKDKDKVEAKAQEKADGEAGKKDVPASEMAVAKPVAKPVTGGGEVSVARAADPTRPPSLASVAAVKAVPRAVKIEGDEAPPENLQLSLAASNVPPPKPLVPVREKKKSKEADAMEITSNEVEMDNAKRTTTFIGKVNLKHPTFHLKSDRLLIYMNEEGQSTKMDSEGDEEAPFKEAVATGARVIVERMNADGKKDVGQARKVVYDALTGDLVLSGGPPQLQSGGSLVKTYSESATITLKKNGNHNVSDRGGSGGGNKVIIPVGKDKKGKPSKEPNLIPSKLGDISNRK